MPVTPAELAGELDRLFFLRIGSFCLRIQNQTPCGWVFPFVGHRSASVYSPTNPISQFELVQIVSIRSELGRFARKTVVLDIKMKVIC